MLVKLFVLIDFLRIVPTVGLRDVAIVDVYATEQGRSLYRIARLAREAVFGAIADARPAIRRCRRRGRRLARSGGGPGVKAPREPAMPSAARQLGQRFTARHLRRAAFLKAASAIDAGLCDS